MKQIPIHLGCRAIKACTARVLICSIFTLASCVNYELSIESCVQPEIVDRRNEIIAAFEDLKKSCEPIPMEIAFSCVASDAVEPIPAWAAHYILMCGSEQDVRLLKQFWSSKPSKLKHAIDHYPSGDRLRE